MVSRIGSSVIREKKRTLGNCLVQKPGVWPSLGELTVVIFLNLNEILKRYSNVVIRYWKRI